MRVTPFTDPNARFLAGRFGMRLFLVSLGMFFAASVLGYLVIVHQSRVWANDLPPLPRILWVSTAVLVFSSVTMQSALAAIRRNRINLTRFMLLLTTYAGVAFIVLQSRAWLDWYGPVARQWSDAADYRYALAGFYVLTGVHAAHVLGGLIPMVIITRNAFRGMYSSEQHAGIHYVTMYWHFLGAVWIVLFAMLQISVK